jgi:hypothetical protein
MMTILNPEIAALFYLRWWLVLPTIKRALEKVLEGIQIKIGSSFSS